MADGANADGQALWPSRNCHDRQGPGHPGLRSARHQGHGPRLCHQQSRRVPPARATPRPPKSSAMCFGPLNGDRSAGVEGQGRAGDDLPERPRLHRLPGRVQVRAPSPNRSIRLRRSTRPSPACRSTAGRSAQGRRARLQPGALLQQSGRLRRRQRLLCPSASPKKPSTMPGSQGPCLRTGSRCWRSTTRRAAG